MAVPLAVLLGTLELLVQLAPLVVKEFRVYVVPQAQQVLLDPKVYRVYKVFREFRV
jgi:hypothetical protein